MASVGPVVGATSATTDGADVLAASIGPLVGVASATTDGADVLVANVAPVQSVAISAALVEGTDIWAASISTPDTKQGGAGEYRKKQKNKVLKDISRLNEIILREALPIFDNTQVTPKSISRVEYDDNDDEDSLMLLFI